MYLFLDTEFTDILDPNPELISLGLISEDGYHEFYVEITDYNYMLASAFVREEVLPLLDHIYGVRRADAAKDLHHWIQGLPSEPIIIMDYNGDWFHFSKLLLEGGPSRNVTGRLLEQQFSKELHRRIALSTNPDASYSRCYKEMLRGIEDYYELHDKRRHHALVDAKANRHGWLQGLNCRG